MNTPNEFRRTYQLYVKKISRLDSQAFWYPVGMEELTRQHAKDWLDANINLWKDNPTIEYKIVETIHYYPTSNVVEEGTKS